MKQQFQDSIETMLIKRRFSSLCCLNNVPFVTLAARLGLSEGSVHKLVDPGPRSHLSSVAVALRAVGRGLVVGDRAVS